MPGSVQPQDAARDFQQALRRVEALEKRLKAALANVPQLWKLSSNGQQILIDRGRAPGLTSFFVDVNGSNSLVVTSTGADLEGTEVLLVADTGNVELNSNTGMIRLQADLEINTIQGASTLGSVIGRIALHDAGHAVVGYLPVYDTIT